jgi:hypothetical protein
MNREERRRAEREARRSGQPFAAGRPWDAPEGRIISERTYDESDLDRQVQDFIAGTVFAAGATLLGPTDGDEGAPPPVFAVMIEPDAATFTAAPVLRRLLAELDRIGAGALGDQLRVGTSWSMLTKSDGHALVKLKLDVVQPFTGSARIVLLAENYASFWQYIADGGIVGLTTMERIQRLATKPNPTFADGIEACVPMGIASSPGLRRIIDMFGWPGANLQP